MDFEYLPQDQRDLLLDLKFRIVRPGEDGNAETRLFFGNILVVSLIGLESDGVTETLSFTPCYYRIDTTKVPYTGRIETMARVDTIEEVYDLLPAVVLQWIVNHGAALFPSLMNVSLHALRVFSQSLVPALRGH